MVDATGLLGDRWGVSDTAVPRRSPRHALSLRLWHERFWLPAGILVATLTSLAMRLPGADRVYDVFIDETTYSSIAGNVASGHGIALYGKPFILHPPVGFWILGAAAHLVGRSDPLTLIFALRPLSMIFGSVVVGLVFAACWLAELRLVAIASAALLAIDP